jgi:hypothetical protein
MTKQDRIKNDLLQKGFTYTGDRVLLGARVIQVRDVDGKFYSIFKSGAVKISIKQVSIK